MGRTDPNRAQWRTAYVGLGSNLGERRKTLQAALRELDAMEGLEVLKVSKFRETEPVGGPPQGRFINAAARVRTTLGPERLLAELQRIEDEFGRERSVRWGPRTLDLDLLLYGDAIVNTPRLKVPHPLLHERRFVLEPLCDLAPELKHPALGKSLKELLHALESKE